VFARRARDLSPDTQTLLLLAAADQPGQANRLWQAAAALGIPQAAVVPAEAAGMLALWPEVRISHPLVRSAIYHGAPAVQRRHAQTGRARALVPAGQGGDRIGGGALPSEEPLCAALRTGGEGQRIMQAASDIFLGWTQGVAADRHYYWRQLRDMKGSAVVETMIPTGLTLYARLCGRTLARAQARPGDPVAIAQYLGDGDEFCRSLTDFSARYADQNEQDFQTFVKAVRSGRLQAVEGV
jgi:hypothetical protein